MDSSANSGAMSTQRSPSPISESDYFRKSPEFRLWLKDNKGKYFHDLSADKARSYFRKFVKAWNKGILPESLYAGIDPSSQSAQSQTSYKWSFSSSSTDQAALRAARQAVGAATYGPSLPPSSSRILGPSLPSASDLVLAREAATESASALREHTRKRERAEDRERVEDQVGPREVGREGALEKKRVKREGDQAFRESRDDAGLEIGESVLMGGGDSFRERIAQRDAARKRFEEKRGSHKDEKQSMLRERQSALREKDNATMEMFKKLAKERFG